MNAKLHEYFPWDSSDISRKFVLIEDNSQLTGDFGLSLLLMKVIKQGNDVVILSVNNSRKHFEHIFRKNGLDLSLLVRSNKVKIHCVDFSHSFWSHSFETVPSTPASPFTSSDYDEIENLVWDHLTSFTLSNFAKDETKPSQVLFIDDLNILEMIAPDNASAIRFISLLYNMFGTSLISSVVVFGRGEDDRFCSDDRTKKVISLLDYCRCRADVTVVSRSLSSGFAGDVHGQLSVTNGFQISHLLFHALETGVHCRLLSGL